MDTARRLALMIAVGIGLHNFSEGLAIGQSAASGEISLALLLIIGFGLHNATEGFGIVAPLPSGKDRPGWGFLALLGLIGGGPTFVGTIIGQAVVSDILSVGFPGTGSWVDPLCGDATASCGRQVGAQGLAVLGAATRPFPRFRDRLRHRRCRSMTSRRCRCRCR